MRNVYFYVRLNYTYKLQNDIIARMTRIKSKCETNSGLTVKEMSKFQYLKQEFTNDPDLLHSWLQEIFIYK
jgi:hypothetical protein